MSGPIATDDVTPVPGAPAQADGPVVEIAPGRRTRVGSLPVRRVLPQRLRRTVGSWCFVDHAGPVPVDPGVSFGIGPHPHMGLQTVTWLVTGELLHLDSLGTEQLIRPGQLNIMTAGHGVSHAEEDPRWRRRSTPSSSGWRSPPPPATARRRSSTTPSCRVSSSTVPRGPCSSVGSTASPRRRGATPSTWAWSSRCAGRARWCLCAPTTSTPWWSSWAGSRWAVRWWSPASWPISGWGATNAALEVAAPARALLLGGLPFPEPLLMWWNFVGRSRDEVSEARRQWSADDGRFGRVRSSLGRIDVGPPPWE